MRMLGISGSLRKGSFNTLLLKAAADRAESIGSKVTLFDLSDIPLFNSDLEDGSKPKAVTALIDAIADADGLIFASPEYNYSLSGVLKNAIDWASRPAFKSVLAGKPCLILSASMSPVGGARGQVHLRDVLACTLTPVYLAPDYLLPSAKNAFDADGSLVDSKAAERLERHLKGFVEWAERSNDAPS